MLRWARATAAAAAEVLGAMGVDRGATTATTTAGCVRGTRAHRRPAALTIECSVGCVVANPWGKGTSTVHLVPLSLE